MPDKRIKQLILDLSFEQKILGIGTILMIISLFLPWYQDLDLFKTGDMFLGVTGPMYFSGYTILFISLINIALLVSGALNVKLPFNVRPSSIYLASGIAFFYLLLLTNSVYFHQKFGVNILNKESPFGMFIAFISASLVTIGGYISTRDKKALLREFQEETQEPLIKLNVQDEQRRPKENLRSLNTQTQQPAPMPEVPAATQPKMPLHNVSLRNMPVAAKASMAGARKPAGMNMVQKAMVDTVADAAREPAVAENNEEALPKRQPQPYRMDL